MNSHAEIVELVRRIHASPVRFVAAAAGGSRLLSDLLTVPGASQSVLEAVVPYAFPSLVEWLGSKPEQACSAPTARAMAMRAFERARHLRDREGASGDGAAGDIGPVVGVGLTASLAADRPKRGPHRVHAAVQSERATWSLSVELEKGARTRDEEESLAAALGLDLIAEACGIDSRPPLPLRSSERIVRRRTEALPSWIALAEHKVGRTAERVGFTGAGDREPKAVFPGSFNPLHVGHLRMAAVASERIGVPVDFEFSVENVEKPPLDFETMTDRAEQFDAATRIWFTRAPRMVQKARLFPGSVIVVGIDTLLRVADPKFADESVAVRDRILDEIESLGCRFLVFGRLFDGRFQTLDDLELPDKLRRISDGVREDIFRSDVSSTELRRSDK